jgi:hypothetical protein
MLPYRFIKKIYEDTFTGLIAFIYDYKTEEINGIETRFVY